MPDLWEFTNLTHPVYERPPEVQGWPYALGGLQPAAYQTADMGIVSEPLEMATAGHPSTSIYREDEATVQEIVLHTRYMDWMVPADEAWIEQAAQQWVYLMHTMSQGPYSLSELREMGHPYGYGGPHTEKVPTWERLSRPRKTPSMGLFAGNVKGTRGRVSDLSIINVQTGTLDAAWRYELEWGEGTVRLRIVNATPAAWFLSHGTVKMQAHGPWQTAQERLLPGIMSAWRTRAGAAWRRSQGRADALVGQFGTEAMMADATWREAGGW